MRSTMSMTIVMVLVFTATLLATGAINPPATVGEQILTGFGGSAGAHEFFLQPGSTWKGDLTGIGAGESWSLVVLGIDATGVTGPADRYIYFNLQDADDGSHYKNLGVNVRLDATGASGGTLFQSYQQWTDDGQSSQGLNPGELTAGHFDLRFDFSKAAFADGWTVTPYYRLDGGVWTMFFDGAFVATVGSIDFDAGKLAVGFDGGADGTVAFENMYLAGPAHAVFVDDDWSGYDSGTAVQFPGASDHRTFGVDAFAEIKIGIDNLVDGTVSVADGLYGTPINIEGRSNVTVTGQSQAGTVFKPSTIVFWEIPGYPAYDSRRAGIRVVAGTDIAFENMTMDFDLIKGNNVAGILYWDATGHLDGNVIENMSVPDLSGGYLEITSYFRAPGYSDGSRAHVDITNNTFLRTGRLGIVSHDFVDLLIDGNVFDKDGADFGYAMELGSASTAVVTGNIIRGFNTPAASDNSASAGIYIENSFTSGMSGISKTIQLETNEIYNCQNGLFIGNQVDNYAGDVDIVITASGNTVRNNSESGVVIVDEDRTNGSSVTASFTGNAVVDNGSVGYHVGSNGDADITVNLTGETITGNTLGIHLYDVLGVSSGSIYAITVTQSTIMGNSGFGIENIYAGCIIAAAHNYWGTLTGPYHPVNNVTGEGNAVSDYVDFMPWCNDDFSYCEYPVACGNTENDDAVNIADAVYLINYIFKGGPAPDPICIGDADGDDLTNLADAVYLVTYVFKGGPPPVIDCCP